VDPAGNVTAWKYEDDLPVVRVGPDGLVTRYERDKRGSLTGLTYPSKIHYQMSYDERGHLLAIQGEEGLLASFTVDARHDVVEELDARGARTAYGYDALGHPIARTDALGRSTSVRYDRLGQPLRVQRPDGTVTQSAYDALGNPSRVVDALGQATEMEYAGTGSLVALKQPDGRRWRFKYTPGEKLRRIENPLGEPYEFAYDTAGRVTKEVTFDTRVLDYRYASSGRLARIDYPDGSFRAFAHDPLGNVLEETSTDGPLRFERDRMGRLLGAVVEQDGERIVTRFERDNLGRVIAETQGERTLRYGYDARGRRIQRTMPDGATTRYQYDASGALAGVEHDGFQLVIQRDKLGRESARGDAEGRFSIRSAYDAMDRIIEQGVDVRTPGGGVPAIAVQRRWQYDRLGRVKQVEDGRWGATEYRYDSIGQLLEAQRGSFREVFAYDAAGSLQKTLEGIEASPEEAAAREPWEIGKGNLLLRTDRAKYAYDARGRRVLKQEGGEGPEAKRTEYVWDARDRLREVRLPSGERVAFAYDAFGRRVRKEIFERQDEQRRAVEFLWDGDALAADMDSEHGARCFVQAPGRFTPLLQAEQGEVFSYINDHVGVPKELIDSKGKVAWSAAHSAWGLVTNASGDPEREARPGRAVTSPFMLLGQYSDDETCLGYTRFRYFDADVGRWCSPDPLGINGGSNTFAFEGSPTEIVDPLGLSGCGDTRRVLTSMSAGPPFDPDTFAKLQKRLTEEGVEVITGAEGEAMLDRISELYGRPVEAAYYQRSGRPGQMLFRPNPSRAAVTEEYFHYEQDKSSRFVLWTQKQRIEKEIEAQNWLLATGKRDGWSDAEMDEISKALDIHKDNLHMLNEASPDDAK
jgi:RHS repeat-associated protein